MWRTRLGKVIGVGWLQRIGRDDSGGVVRTCAGGRRRDCGQQIVDGEREICYDLPYSSVNSDNRLSVGAVKDLFFGGSFFI